MALPDNYTYDNDTLSTLAWQSTNNNLNNLLTKEGEKLIPELSARGRTFGVPNTEQWTNTAFYDDPGDATFRGVTPGTAGTGATLGQTTKEFLTKTVFTHKEWQNNVTFETTMPPGIDGMDYMRDLVVAKRAVVFNREEALLIRGADTLTGAYAINAPYAADDDFDSVNGHPMSLLSLYASGCVKGGAAGSVSGDKSAQKFANISEDDNTEWVPTVTATGNANGSVLVADFRKAIANASYGPQSPNYALTGIDIWSQFAGLIFTQSALPQIQNIDVVKDPASAIMVAGIPLVWTRYLADKTSAWDFTGASQSEYPILLLNLKSLRLNIPVSGGEMGFQFIRKISNIQVRELQTRSFYRICAKRSYSIDNGRRSFGAIEGVTL